MKIGQYVVFESYRPGPNFAGKALGTIVSINKQNKTIHIKRLDNIKDTELYNRDFDREDVNYITTEEAFLVKLEL